MELKEGIKQINQSVTQSSASDATLEGYMLELKDANGNLVDKQPVSKLESLVYNYLTTKRQSELAKVMSVQESLSGANDNVFIMFHRKSDNYPLMVKPDRWAGYQNSGEVATGVAVVAGERILVVAPTEASLNWSSANVAGGGKTTADCPTALGDFDGKANTSSQITRSEASGASYAPGYCAQYSRVNANGQGLTAGKWWLPSLGELMMIYANKDKINYALSIIDASTQLGGNWNWSSTEYSASKAWRLPIADGSAYYGTKVAGQGAVRAVSSISLNLPSFYKDYENVAELTAAVGGLLSLDAFNKDFNIDTSVFDGVSYNNVNYQLTFTSKQNNTVWDGTYPFEDKGGGRLLQFTVGPYRCQIFIPKSGLPATRVFYGKWFDWQTLPSFYKNYPDIASLSKGVGGLQKSIYQSGGALENVKITLASKEKGDYADVYVYNYGSFGGNGGSMHKILISKTDAISITPIISNNTTSLTKLDDNSVSVPLLEYSMLVVYSNMDITIQKL